jgi:hypothetical protein
VTIASGARSAALAIVYAIFFVIFNHIEQLEQRDARSGQ